MFQINRTILANIKNHRYTLHTDITQMYKSLASDYTWKNTKASKIEVKVEKTANYNKDLLKTKLIKCWKYQVSILVWVIGEHKLTLAE